nr:hypothetical protein [uncultured Caproiciproducens sp.]
MKITEEAKSLITKALISNDCDYLQVSQQKSCCGTSLVFGLGKKKTGDEPVSIDGVSVLMDNETKARVEGVTLAAEKDELIIQDDAQSCCC